MTDCLFCKIAKKDLPATIIYEDDKFMAFKDIHPKAEFHLLAIPKKHMINLTKLEAEDSEILGYMLSKLHEVAVTQGYSEGFRTIINSGPGGKQEVYHLHMHILAGGKIPGF